MTGRIGQLGVVGLCVLLVGCQSTSSVPPATAEPTTAGAPASSSPEPASSPTGAPSPAPAAWDSFGILPAAQPADFANGILCTGAIGASDPIAIVDLDAGGGSARVLMDYSDPAKPRVACTLDDVAVVQVIDPHHIVISAGDARTFAVVDLPAVRYHWFALAAAKGDFPSTLLAVSPDLGEVAWNEIENGSPFDRIHLATANADRVIARLPDTNGGRCGSPTDSNPAAYSRSGSALFVLDEPLPEISLIVVEAGRLALSLVGSTGAAISTRPLKALWSPATESLYYTQSGSIWRWTEAAGPKVYLRGTTWEAAAFSPDGGRLAYDVLGPGGHREVDLIDLAEGGHPVRIGGADRGVPAFLNDGQLLYGSDFVTGSCGDQPQQSWIYDLASGAEAASSLEQVELTWPATKT
jgi:hypothetical protein